MKTCPLCHHLNKDAFPLPIRQPLQLGSNVQQLTVYFTRYQLLTYQRISGIFKDLFGHVLSIFFLVNTTTLLGSSVNLMEDLNAKLLEEQVCMQMRQAFTLGVNVTGYIVTKNQYLFNLTKFLKNAKQISKRKYILFK